MRRARRAAPGHDEREGGASCVKMMRHFRDHQAHDRPSRAIPISPAAHPRRRCRASRRTGPVAIPPILWRAVRQLCHRDPSRLCDGRQRAGLAAGRVGRRVVPAHRLAGGREPPVPAAAGRLRGRAALGVGVLRAVMAVGPVLGAGRTGRGAVARRHDVGVRLRDAGGHVQRRGAVAVGLPASLRGICAGHAGAVHRGLPAPGRRAASGLRRLRVLPAGREHVFQRHHLSQPEDHGVAAVREPGPDRRPAA
ncbi:hypothetical protein G6F31_015781 [Rhizopus arrhizus]|nr:hypothetical protein G6F31_015781 [Rhizopus arrhizus]